MCDFGIPASQATSERAVSSTTAAGNGQTRLHDAGATARRERPPSRGITRLGGLHVLQSARLSGFTRTVSEKEENRPPAPSTAAVHDEVASRAAAARAPGLGGVSKADAEAGAATPAALEEEEEEEVLEAVEADERLEVECD